MPAIASSSGESHPPVLFEKKYIFFCCWRNGGEIKATSTAKITATHITISAPIPPASVTWVSTVSTTRSAATTATPTRGLTTPYLDPNPRSLACLWMRVLKGLEAMKIDRIQEQKRGMKKAFVGYGFWTLGFPSIPSSHFLFSLTIDEYTVIHVHLHLFGLALNLYRMIEKMKSLLFLSLIIQEKFFCHSVHPTSLPQLLLTKIYQSFKNLINLLHKIDHHVMHDFTRLSFSWPILSLKIHWKSSR